MNKRNDKHCKRNIQMRKRKTNSRNFLFITFSITIIIIVILWSLLFKDYKEHVVLNSTDTHPELTMNDDISETIEKSQNLQSLTGKTGWNLILVNKWNPLPDNYEINLTEVPGGEKVDERIYDPLMKMLEAAKEANWGQMPEIVSGYRTSKKQQELYNDKLAKFKQEGYSNDEAARQTEQWVAVPGYSEHQLGIAVDINGATYDLYLWLQQNSYKYGFIFRYPGSKANITGTAEEVWHYRYVGKDAAKEIYEQGLCLEEYLDRT